MYVCFKIHVIPSKLTGAFMDLVHYKFDGSSFCNFKEWCCSLGFPDNMVNYKLLGVVIDK